jgi:hypothetical protein
VAAENVDLGQRLKQVRPRGLMTIQRLHRSAANAAIAQRFLDGPNKDRMRADLKEQGWLSIADAGHR